MVNVVKSGVAVVVMMFVVIVLIPTARGEYVAEKYQPKSGYDSYDDLNKYVIGQGLIGAAVYEDVTFRQASKIDSSVVAENEISSMPIIGIGGQLPMVEVGKKTVLGFDGGIAFSWRSSVSSISSANGNVKMTLDNDLYMVDVFWGGLISRYVTQKARIYGGAGPIFLFGNYWGKSKDENTVTDDVSLASEKSSAFGIGWYSRAGIEVRMANGAFMGLGVLWQDATIDFGTSSAGKIDFDGIMPMVTCTFGF